MSGPVRLGGPLSPARSGLTGKENKMYEVKIWVPEKHGGMRLKKVISAASAASARRNFWKNFKSGREEMAEAGRSKANKRMRGELAAGKECAE